MSDLIARLRQKPEERVVSGQRNADAKSLLIRNQSDKVYSPTNLDRTNFGSLDMIEDFE